MRNLEIKPYNKGVINEFDSDLIPREASSDSLNWRTRLDGIELSRGKLIVGNEVDSAGAIQSLAFGYYGRVAQTVQFRKSGTKIQHLDTVTSTWIDIITGLTEDARYTFAQYTSLAGHFTFAGGADGLYKIDNSNPGSYLNMYDDEVNHKGYIKIDKGRMFLWGNPNDPTSYYMSHIDEANYTTVTAEVVGTGDGSGLTFSDTLVAVQGTRTLFGIFVVAQTKTATNVSNVTQAREPVVTSTAHGLVVGDKVDFASIGGMTELNDLYADVLEVVDANNFRINIDTTGFTAYTSGGTAQRVEIFTDGRNGVLTSNRGGEGTINYISGAIALEFINAPLNTTDILADYQWEDSNDGGVSDFTYTTPERAAGEGDLLRQDIGSSPIVNVEIIDGTHFCIHENVIYRVVLSIDDETVDNNVFRQNIGTKSVYGSTSTSIGIVLLNTFNPEKAKLTIIERNIVGDDFTTRELAETFDFSRYEWDECSMIPYGERLIISGRTRGANANDRVFDYHIQNKTVDIYGQNVNVFAQDAGLLYMGESISGNVYQLFSGFDDDGLEIDNFWKGSDDSLGLPRNLKKTKWLELEGYITPDIQCAVYLKYDGGSSSLIGTIRGDGTYVDSNDSYMVGSTEVGEAEVGGGGDGITASYFNLKIKTRAPKFRRRTLYLVASGIGYIKIKGTTDADIRIFEERLPNKYRQQSYVSLDGTQQAMDTPNG